MEKHDYIQGLIDKELSSLEGKSDSSERVERLRKVQKFIGSKYQNFFENISMDLAISILRDVGVKEDDLVKIYVELMQEELDSKYVVVGNLNLNNNKEEER